MEVDMTSTRKYTSLWWGIAIATFFLLLLALVMALSSGVEAATEIGSQGGSSSSLAYLLTDDHLLLCEAVVTPTSDEFIEIVNPSDSSVSLGDYYVSDDEDYALLAGQFGAGPAPAIGSSDFIAQFPPGATISATSTLLVAFDGAGFEATFGFKADFELHGTDAGTPDMIETYAGSIGASAGLTNSGENAVIFYWDGASDLVLDVDMTNLGTPSSTNDIGNKTGLSVDGPDADVITTTYAIDGYTMPQQATDPGFGFSTKRILPEAGFEVSGGGNGLTGDDETTEQIGTTWDSTYTAPNPGTCAILPTSRVVVNEFEPKGTEWIELYNAGSVGQDMTGWEVTDGDGVTDTLSASISAGAFYTYETSLSLSNSGDQIYLYDNNRELVDSVAYGNAGGAPLAQVGHSAARLAGGVDTDDHARDWNLDTSPTPGAANDVPGIALGSSLIFNEFDNYPAVSGDPDRVELFNPTGSSITITGWMLSDGDNLSTLPGGTVPAGGWHVLIEGIDFTSSTDFSSSDVGYLYDSAGIRVDQIGWTGEFENDCFARVPDGVGPNDGFNWSSSSGGVLFVDQACTFGSTNGEQSIIVINEIHADPDSTNGDANGDGVVNTTQDEFFEVVNISGSDLDLSGWSMADVFGTRHVFPPATLIPDTCSVLVFGGGTPTGDFGNSTAQTASGGALGLNNSGDTVTLYELTTSAVAAYAYGSEGGNNQSITRDPDITGLDPLIQHTTATGAGGALFSPGTMVDGSQFIGCPPLAVNDLSVSKTGPEYIVGATGENLVYELILDNQSVTTATSVVVTDTLPSGVDYVSDNSGISPTNPSPGVYEWSLPDIPTATVYSFNITASVNVTPSSGEVLTNSVEIATTLPGDDPGNNIDEWYTTAYPLVTIHDIQFVVDPAVSDTSPLEGQIVWVEGIVTAEPGEIDTPLRMMVIEEAAGGPWSGLPVYRVSGFGGLTAPEGTIVRALGTVEEFFGLTEFQLSGDPWAVEVIGTATTPAAELLLTAGFDDVSAAVSEQWEAVLIEFQDAVVTDGDLGFGEWEFDDTSGPARADDFGGSDGNLTYNPVTGDTYEFIRGIGWWSFGNYKLAPRYNADIGLFVEAPIIEKDAATLVAPDALLTYTITVENQFSYDLLNTVVTDTVPANSSFAYALDGGSEVGGNVTWNVGLLPALSATTVRFAVTATNEITTIVNSQYSVVASNYVTPTFGPEILTYVAQSLRIHDIQAATHYSPLTGRQVSDIYGIVTAIANTGFYMQDSIIDAYDETSEAIYVYVGATPNVSVGNEVWVSGTVNEYYPGGVTSGSLSRTELNDVVIILPEGPSSFVPLPASTIIGSAGRIPPNTIIEDDANGSMNTTNDFDPDEDGIDFYESMEAMLVQVDNAIVVGSNRFGEIAVVGDSGANAGLLTPRGGIVIQPSDFNPERIITDDWFNSNEPDVNVGDAFTDIITGVLDYDFGNFKLRNINALPAIAPGGLTRETTTLAGTADQVTVASFNVENLDPGDDPVKFTALAQEIVNNLLAPDIISLQEIQDNTGPTDDGVVDASDTYNALIAAIIVEGGPTYEFRDIAPVDKQDGGQPGANIRVGFLFRPDRVTFVDRPGGDATTATTPLLGLSGIELTFSPGRIDPTASAFDDSRKPLAGEFEFNGRKLIVIAGHFNSKGGDGALFGLIQPPIFTSEIQRGQQAQVVNDFVDSILALDSDAGVLVAGDLNDFQFSTPLNILSGDVLTDLVNTLPMEEQYTYIFDGNSQVLDHILVSGYLFTSASPAFDIVHANAEFDTDFRPTDHDPLVAQLTLPELVPVIDVKPTSMSSAQPPDVTRTQQMTITNLGTADLNWEIFEEAAPTGGDVSNGLLECGTGDLAWLSTTPISGTNAAGTLTVVDVTFDSTGLTSGTYEGTLCIESNDQETPEVRVPVSLDVSIGPSIDLVKTVGDVPGSCAPTNSISVPAGGGGTDVYYCYEATNTGDVTFTSHSLVDSELGTIFVDLPFDLAPGDSVDTVSMGLVISATITDTTINTATWTASDAAGGQTNATETATVVVEPPTSVSLSSIGEPDSASMLPALVLVSSLLAIAGFTIMRKRQRAG
jgi:uncharacterized repeat protein (TIGR01451 family)